MNYLSNSYQEIANRNIETNDFSCIDNILVIVDVQEEFNYCFNDEYLEDLRIFVQNNEFKQIVLIVDITEGIANVPYWLKNSADIIIGKTYLSPTLNDIKVNYKNYKKETNKLSWRNMYKQLVIPTNNAHETFTLPEKLEDTINNIDSSDTVVLIGGAMGYCLADIYESLIFFNKNVVFNTSYIYHEESNFGVFIENWTSINEEIF